MQISHHLLILKQILADTNDAIVLVVASKVSPLSDDCEALQGRGNTVTVPTQEGMRCLKSSGNSTLPGAEDPLETDDVPLCALH